MTEHPGQSTSIWMSSATPGFGRLGGDVSADVCIVGAGVAGLTTALLLAYEGRSVVVLNDGPIGGGQTCRTTAHLSTAIDARYHEIERLHGRDGARLVADSHGAAIDCIERIVERESIDCGFERVDGYLFANAGRDVDELDYELDAVRRAGLTAVDRLERAPFEQLHVGPCLRFPRQAQFHPMQYLAAVATALQSFGGRIFCGSRAREISGGRPARVHTENGDVLATDSVVVATNTPINDRVAIHTKQAAYRTYAISMKVEPGSAPHALFWDTADPYHYVRLYTGADGEGRESLRDTLIIGGEDHKTGQSDDAADRYLRLEDWARGRFPVVGRPIDSWSGQVLETIDGIAFIGHNPLDSENVYVATGDCGMGMTHGTIAGLLLTDLIMQRENEWARLYDPSRKSLKAVVRYAAENTNTAWQYTDWLTPGATTRVGELRPGCGAILRRGLSKVAVYRDEESNVHVLSAVCPHLGGVVHWNSAEHTWDCPCHGSRFDALGRVIEGPANSDLQPAETEPEAEIEAPGAGPSAHQPHHGSPR
ncbi:MAG TPA: FAD-dependent oxidoreductase [Candidatus Binatia bacterium]|jgi:glycine/D-amino acid oxidase-like deaminating enzyme/nitrite reductase/ring-hydroxylating ferredoxin subunit